MAESAPSKVKRNWFIFIIAVAFFVSATVQSYVSRGKASEALVIYDQILSLTDDMKLISYIATEVSIKLDLHDRELADLRDLATGQRHNIDTLIHPASSCALDTEGNQR